MIKFQGVDLFAGAGGVSSGILDAEYEGEKIASVICAINHDELAIESHKRNHLFVKHFTEDIRNFDVHKIPQLDDNVDAITYLWASLECTNFSNAKGGKPRDADSRTLAEHLNRYVEYLFTDYIFIENVREFLSWGPLDKFGRPISKHKGKDFIKWCEKITQYGYDYHYRILNTADYGAYTSRKRLFIIFAKKGLPIVFPKPTHSKTGENELLKWNAVKDKLNLQDEGESIFDRTARGKKPLVQNTLNRIAYGIEKYCLPEGAGKFLMSYYGSGKNILGIDQPAPTVTTNDRFALVHVEKNRFIEQRYGNEKNVQTVDKPLNTITVNPKSTLITVLKNAGIIKDIKMRMLTVQELKDITGFRSDYILMGDQKKQKKFIGNAVPPIIVKKIFEALYEANLENRIRVAV